MTSLEIINSWLSLILAIIFGVLGTTSMKLSHGFHARKHVWGMAIFYVLSFVALTFAIKYIQLSVVYAVWSGLGTVIVSAVSMTYFGERVSVRKIFFLTIIILGVIGLHCTDGFA